MNKCVFATKISQFSTVQWQQNTVSRNNLMFLNSFLQILSCSQFTKFERTGSLCEELMGSFGSRKFGTISKIVEKM